MRRLPLLLSTIGLSALFTIGCGGAESSLRTNRVVPVTLAAVANETVSVPITTAGRVAAMTESRLAFKIAGVVDAMPVEAGDQVSRGDILARLQLDEIDAQVIQAERALEKAERDYERIASLYVDSAAPLEALQDTETARDVAEAQLRIASFNRRHAVITAPADGRVLRTHAETDELIQAGQSIISFGATGSHWLVVTGLADRDVVRIATGDSVAVTIDALPSTELSGTVVTIAQAPEPRSGAYRVEVQLTATDLPLASGFVANVKFFPADRMQLSMIPIESLVEADGGSAWVFTIDSGGVYAVRHEVTLGPIVGNRIGIIDGLTDIDTVIAVGAPYLVAGTAVRVAGEK